MDLILLSFPREIKSLVKIYNNKGPDFTLFLMNAMDDGPTRRNVFHISANILAPQPPHGMGQIRQGHEPPPMQIA